MNRRGVMLGVATSRDLVFRKKRGAAFAGSRYETMMMKSAAIVHRRERDPAGGERLAAARIGGRYRMLFGQGGIHAATSTDLIGWTPMGRAPGRLKAVMEPRPGRFDSALAEVDPPPVVTKAGIVMLYNGEDGGAGIGDPSRPAGEYACGRAVLDPRDPTRAPSRAHAPVFAPDLP